MFLIASIVAYILNGIAATIDKTIINRDVKSPLVYTFFIGIINYIVLGLIPFGGNILSGQALALTLGSGIFLTLAFATFFKSLRQFDLLISAPLIGVLNPLFSVLIGSLLFGQILTTGQWQAFILLMLGSIIITANLWLKKRAITKDMLWIVGSGLFFALSYLLLKVSFDRAEFIDVLLTSRLSMAVIVTFFLIHPQIRRDIFHSKISRNNFANRVSYLLFSGQLAGALSGLLIIYAVSLANPAIVNSMFGIQFGVMLILTLLLSRRYPNLLHENLTKRVLAFKIAGLLLFSFGLALLANNT